MDGQVITPTLTPSLVYDDAREGIRWLTEVLGFRAATVYDAPDGSVAFAELVWRTGVVFVSSRPPADNSWAKVGIASIALAAEDAETVDRLYQRAVAAGADIIRPVHDARTPAFPEGSHQFDLRDPEGGLWTVGTFQPRIPVRDP
ncbi:MAG: VOC family protein [Vicinamibacteria bacterium]